jgi:hypothetical protein
MRNVSDVASINLSWAAVNMTSIPLVNGGFLDLKAYYISLLNAARASEGTGCDNNDAHGL